MTAASAWQTPLLGWEAICSAQKNAPNRAKETVAVVFETVDRLQRSFKDMPIIDDLIKEGLIELHFYRAGLVIER